MRVPSSKDLGLVCWTDKYGWRPATSLLCLDLGVPKSMALASNLGVLFMLSKLVYAEA
jgi:hypothetical protein